MSGTMDHQKRISYLCEFYDPEESEDDYYSVEANDARAPSTQPKRQKRYDWPAVFGLSFLVGLSLGAIVGAIAGAIYGAIDDEESGTWWLGMINLNALIGAGIGTGVGGVIGIVSPFMFVWTNY